MLDHPVKTTRTVLVVEDSEDDVLLLSLTLRQGKIPWKIASAVSDGEQAIAWLRKAYPRDKPNSGVRIDLLLIDLKMPRKDGFDVLRWVKEHLPGRFKVVVFSSSLARSDVARARQLGANFYEVKPVSSEERKQVLLHLEQCLSSAKRCGQESDLHRHFADESLREFARFSSHR
jgi:CheY-like chemotaxis protein